MAKLINGNGNPAVYAAEDSDWFAAIMGNTTAITAIGEQFRADQADANTIEVFDGVIITQEGRRIQLDVNDVDLFEIPTGTPGDTSYYIIGYHLVTDTDSNQSCETFVQKMDDGSETIPENTFRGGADDVYISLYRVTQTGLNITSIDLLLPSVSNINQMSEFLAVKNLVNTYYDSVAEKLYIVNADGTRGSEIKVGNQLPNYVVDVMGYNALWSGSSLNTYIADNINGTSELVKGAVSQDKLNSAYITSSNPNQYYLEATVNKDCWFYPNNNPVPTFLPAGSTLQLGYPANGSNITATSGTFAFYN